MAMVPELPSESLSGVAAARPDQVCLVFMNMTLD